MNDYVHKFRGRAKYTNIVLKRGATKQQGLLTWFRACQTKAERKPVTIKLVASDGSVVRTWSVVGGFPVKWTGPSLNANSNNLATEQLEIAHQGFSPGA